ncbi:nicotinate-nucleotide--dimethylbenzimidazole phosphoribosyltransferase [Halopseudomonas bauzanensis]|uniref:Nicotinate-nucleotide--dimethylbenzimidazole phosphoribosyltransferase n=1 Tax=Halopseudomonas bauzanensis TaxID=653930 RepID=A0A4U0YGL3_9GAMM|nr:nicotinate-nucleotide--dimethylbenzimidazole phosphoribosyltransferase [Halopseudomonas bauzanensis]EZQ17193.1 nicotinate-nucleotide--dimethylbenzimidazole phosphoribosyltransferase [Halopseudomonas bauzanensis]TKA90228.1 nicotinate-nucleotide--dimethylbenzimidazole phosphoribosyltransferase [Halopseudomonas bauzanensis]
MTEWWQEAVAQVDRLALEQAQQRQTQLTKPQGALGRLEQLAIRLAGWQGNARPQLERVWISVFAGDHGVAVEGVSTVPQAVTGQMLRNFANGGAAINVMARQLGATLDLWDLGLAVPLDPLPGVHHLNLAPGSANLLREPAMTGALCQQALLAGRQAVLDAAGQGAQLFIAGEMGIGNTTPACAMASLLLDQPVALLVGPGTGLDAEGLRHKTAVIETAVGLHGPQCHTALDVLERLGGLEIAAIAGAYLAAAQQGIPMLVDGYICSTAALCATRLNPACRDWMLFGHRSAEPGHAAVLAALQAEPLLDLGMRLGEGTGAAASVPLLRMACALHSDMATFAEAAVAAEPATC